VACKWLGIREYGVDNMAEVVETRAANDMETIFRDVWTGLGIFDIDSETGAAAETISAAATHVLSNYNLLIASPPCQTFSMAGSGKGREALDDVYKAIDLGLYKDPEQLKKLESITDPRTALVLTPLAYAYRDRPMYVVFEQVPPVLPVWEECGKVLEDMGYSVVTGIVNAEQYGVPQTRKRAILIARRDGKEAKFPVPTHSKYYNREPKKLDEGVLPWVSMAEALGWGTTEKPSYTVTGGGRGTGGYEAFPTGARQGMAKAIEEGDWALRSNYGTNGDPANRGERGSDQPAPTLTSKADRNFWVLQGNQKSGGRDIVEVSSQSVNGGPRAERPIDEPAFTVTQNTDRVVFEERGPVPAIEGEQSDDITWPNNRPSPTIVGSFAPDVVAAPGYRRAGDPPRQKTPGSVRVTVEDAEVLQSYPPMVWKGTKGKVFLQIGNAVPPRLGAAILAALLETE
jgi:DNA (cytosine-5)-methyltransferase 1